MRVALRSCAAGAVVFGALLVSGCFPAHCHNYAAGEPEMRAACAASLHFDGRYYHGRSVDTRVEGQPMERVARIPPCYDQGQPCAEEKPSDFPTQKVARIPGIDPHKAIIAPSSDRHSIYISSSLSDRQEKDVYERAVAAIREAK